MKKLLSIGQLIDKTWDFYKENFTDLMGISAWLLLTALVGVAGWALFPDIEQLSRMATLEEGIDLSTMETVGISLVLLERFVIFPILSIWVFSSLAEFINKRLNAQRPRIKHALLNGWKHLLPVLLSRFLYSLIVAGGILIGIGPVVLLLLLGVPYEGTSAIIMTLIGLIGLAIATVLVIRWAVMYYLGGFGYANVIDQKHGLKSMKHSKRFSTGRFWPTLIRLAIPKILFIGIAAVIVTLLEPVFGILQSLMTQGISPFIQIRLQTMFVFVWPTIFMVFINPLVYIADVLIYRDLRDTISESDNETTISQGETAALNA